MLDFLLVALIAILLGAAVKYIIRAKKSGVKCIGCSCAGSCRSHHTSCTCSGGCTGCSECTQKQDRSSL